jgi:UDP-N-acetyl-2-amino-2-deoxyglucuronate dehydrogenase
MQRIYKDRKIRIGVVGCGRISANHFKAIEAHTSELLLSAVCDTDPTALRTASELYGVHGYASVVDLPDNAEVDVVALCTPSELHPPQAIQAARAGRHVVTEKPMATRWSDGLIRREELSCERMRSVSARAPREIGLRGGVRRWQE